MKIFNWLLTGIGSFLFLLGATSQWLYLTRKGPLSTTQILLLSVGVLALLVGVFVKLPALPKSKLQMRWLGPAYQVVAINLLTVLVLIFALDALAGLAVGIRARVSMNKRKELNLVPPYYSQQSWGEQLEKDNITTSSSKYFPYNVWRRTANQTPTIQVNAAGIRQTPGAQCEQKNAYRIFFFGGSTTWGSGAPDWGTIPAYVQASLEKSSKRPVCVVNFGESGYMSTQELITLVLELERGHIPHQVVFYDGVNDPYTA
jgi:hypothetical protein